MGITLTAIDHIFAHPMFKIIAAVILFYIICYLPIQRMEGQHLHGLYDKPKKGKTRYQWVFFFTDSIGVIVTPPNDEGRRP